MPLDVLIWFLAHLKSKSNQVHLVAGVASKMADNTTMLSICDPVHIVLIKTEPSGDTVLVSSHHLEWRTVLAAPSTRCTIGVELFGTGKNILTF